MTDLTPPALTSAVPGIRPPRHRYDRRFILWRTLRTLLAAIIVMGGLSLLYGLVPATRPWLQPLLVIGGGLFVVQLTIAPTWRYLVHRWEVTDDAVYSLEGWLTRRWQVVPISRIQRIDTARGLLQQWLGLATLTVSTASMAVEITIEGLDAEVAAETAYRLNEVTAATPGDTT